MTDKLDTFKSWEGRGEAGMAPEAVLHRECLRNGMCYGGVKTK